MTRISIRSLDPVDPSTPPADGTRLLQDVLATPRPSSGRRRRAALLRFAPVALAFAVVAGVVAVAVWGEGTGDEEEAAAGSGRAAIIHYVVRERIGTPDGSQPVATHEHWQLSDGSRARTVSRWETSGPLQGTTSEDVVTRTQTLAYRPASEEQPATIIRYRASDDFDAIPQDPPTFAAPPIGGSPEVGDPRTVPDRLAVGDKAVRRLPDATVRGVAVKQFQVGDCRESTSPAIDLSQRAIIALERETLTPVRVTLEPCQLSVGSRILDYVSFGELDLTPKNRELLELSPHPGVPVVDGIEIDKAEERDETGPAPTPTPTAG